MGQASTQLGAANKKGERVNHLVTMSGRHPGQAVRKGNRTANDKGARMQLRSIKGQTASEAGIQEENLFIAQSLAAAAQGDIAAYFDLGVAYSTGSQGAECDLVEAHKWFNLAASKGHEEASWCRADISDEMTAREIAEAQRRARQWMMQERKVA